MLYYEVGDVVTLKKPHPCGENLWEIKRKGVDMRLQCLGCDRDLWMARRDFEKRVRRIKDEETGKFVSIVHYRQDE